MSVEVQMRELAERVQGFARPSPGRSRLAVEHRGPARNAPGHQAPLARHRQVYGGAPGRAAGRIVDLAPAEGRAVTERDRVRFGGTTIDYEVRRSKRRRKTVQITVDGGGVRVAAPMTTADGELRAIVRRRAPWIISHASRDVVGGSSEALRQRRDTAVPGPQRPHDRDARRRALAGSPLRSLAAFGSPCRKVSTTRNGPSESGAPSLGGIRPRAAERLPAGRGALVAPPRPGTEAARPHPRSTPALGKLRPRRHAALQLARHDAGACAHRVHRRSRTRPSDAPEPLSGFLGPGVQRNARRARSASAAAGGRAGAGAVTPAPTTRGATPSFTTHPWGSRHGFAYPLTEGQPPRRRPSPGS